MPFRYAAPECLSGGLYTTESDTWSYGISVWEIFTLGLEPYLYPEGIVGSDKNEVNWQNMQDLKKLLASGYRLFKPELCPSSIYELMLSCWDFNRKLRPTAKSITTSITQAIENYQEPINSVNNLPVSDSKNYVLPKCIRISCNKPKTREGGVL